MAEFRRPIDFYGVVLDEVSQTPVAGAEVFLSPLDDPNAQHPSEHRRTSDKEGRFELTGAKGHDLHVKVSKAGYYQTKLSEGLFTHGAPVPSVGERPLAPDPSAPATFYLHKQGAPAAKLVRVEHERGRVPRDGTAVEISLATGRKVPAGGHLKVEAQVNDQAVPRGEPYDWSYRISVPNGGLVERTDPFAFEAPAGGYRPSDEFRFPASLGRSGWNDTTAKEYFVQAGDGRYARMKFEMIVGGQFPFYVLESYLNPTPGDRNLEAAETSSDNGVSSP